MDKPTIDAISKLEEAIVCLKERRTLSALDLIEKSKRDINSGAWVRFALGK